MFKLKKKKLVAFALSSFMAVGILGTTVVSAHPHDDAPPPPGYDEPAPPPPEHHKHWVPSHQDRHGNLVKAHWE